MSALLRSGRTVFLGAALLFVGATVSADMIWDWSFGSEAGTFVTDGTPQDATGAFDFTIKTLTVTSSVDSEDIGVAYTDQDPPSGFLWNGSAPTQFHRAGGAFTNGVNITDPTTFHFFTFEPPGIDSLFRTGSKGLLDSGTLALSPRIPLQVPVLSPGLLGLLGVLVAGAALRILRAAS